MIAKQKITASDYQPPEKVKYVEQIQNVLHRFCN